MLNLPRRKKPIVTMSTDTGCELIVSHRPGKFGHVSFGIGGRHFLAHRLAYEQQFGEIPPDMVVRHKCDNPNCINVDHLELGSHVDNVKDRVERDRSAKGSIHGRAKLTENDVRNIRKSELTIGELAKLYKVDPKAIRNIVTFRTWKHIS